MDLLDFLAWKTSFTGKTALKNPLFAEKKLKKRILWIKQLD